MILLLVFSLLFLAQPAFATLTLDFWHSMSGAKGVLLNGIVADFNALPESRGKVEVRPEFVGSYEEGLNKLRTALIAGRGPHVVQITDIGTRVMIDSGAVTPIQDFIDQDPDFPLAQLLPPIRHYYEVGGRLYSLPFASSNPIVYYNRDAFKAAGVAQPPQTFAELEADALKLTNPVTHQVGLTWPLNSWFFEQFLARQGADLVLPENGRAGPRPTEANYLCPEAIEFVSLWERLTEKGAFANVGRGWDPAEQNFMAARAAMLITSTSDIIEVSGEVPFHLGLAPIPTRDPAHPGGTIIGGNSLWILSSKPPAEQAAAYRFLKYLASEKVQANWHSHTGYFPIRADVIDQLKREGFYDKNPGEWVAIEQLRASPDLPATRGALMGVFPEARDHVATAIEEIIAGQATIKDALTRAKRKTDFSLLRYNRGKPR